MKKDHIKSNLSQDIKKWRQKKRLSQLQLADLMGLNRRAISEWENDLVVPQERNRIKLGYIFDAKVTLEGIIENHKHMEIDKEDHVVDPSQKDDKDWYKKTIEVLIHQNGNSIEKLTETADKLHGRDLAEIEDLRKEKSLLWEEKSKIWEHIDTLVVHLKPPQKTQ